MITENSFIEHAGAALLLACMLKCIHYVVISSYKQGRYFWIAACFIFTLVLRKELNYLPDLLVPANFLWLGQGYDWWEDMILSIFGGIALVLLAMSRPYWVYILKRVPLILYVIVAVLAALQYVGEHAILFSEASGVMIEELSEDIVYTIALVYLWRLGLVTLEQKMMTIKTLARTKDRDTEPST